jgi:hypothetical protein
MPGIECSKASGETKALEATAAQESLILTDRGTLSIVAVLNIMNISSIWQLRMLTIPALELGLPKPMVFAIASIALYSMSFIKLPFVKKSIKVVSNYNMMSMSG